MSHITGSAGEPRVTGKRARRALPLLPILLVLVFLVGGGNLLASWQQVQSFRNQLHAQQAAEQKVASRELGALCADVGTMARIPPPAGLAAANPSRAYEQAEARAWRGLVLDLGCNARAGNEAGATSAASRSPGGPG